MGEKTNNGCKPLNKEQRLELVDRLESYRLDKGLTYEKLALLIGCGGRSGSAFRMAFKLHRAYSPLIAAKIQRHLEDVHA